METVKLIEMIRQNNCVDFPVMKECEAQPDEFCILYRMAADRLEELETKLAAAKQEQQAIFRLGQMDMRQAAVDALLEEADGTYGLISSTLIHAAESIGKLGKSYAAGGVKDDA